MLRVKIFSTINDPSKLEQDINDWLENLENDGRDVEITKVIKRQNGDFLQYIITVTIFYISD